MVKQPATVVHVRLPPDTYEKVQALADQHGVSVHAEVIRAVEAHLAGAGELDQASAIETATLAMFAASHGGLGDVLGQEFVAGQFKVAMAELFQALGAEELTDTRLVKAAAAKVVAEMRGGKDTPLADAGRALRLREIKS